MLRAVLIMLVGMSLIPLGDTAGKLLTNAHGAPTPYVAFTRFFIGALLVAPFVVRENLGALTDWRIWLRGSLITGGILSILTALETAPIADVFGAFFIGPVISYVLSAVFLRETAGPVRSLLLLIGFCGVLLVVQPGGQMSPGILWAVLAGCFYGAFLTASKWLVGLAVPKVLLFSQLAIGALITAPLSVAAWPVITPAIGWLTLASAASSMLGNLLLIIAFRMTDSTRLAPFVYFQLVSATALGWAVFGTLPNALACAGLALLVGSGFATLALKR